jgi:hypothetical protein
MSIPMNLPLVGGANPWIVLGPLTALAATAGWLVSEVDRRLQVRGKVRTLTRPEEKVLPKAA